MSNNIPTILLLCMEPQYIKAFEEAVATHWPSLHDKINLEILNSSLSYIAEERKDCRTGTTNKPPKFDLIVSPANSYGLLDGAFDDAISRTFCSGMGYHYSTLTHAAQDVLYEKWRGFAPPGSCTLVRFPEVLLQEKAMNVFGCRFLGLCPTMRFPENVKWDREVVYEVVWALLCQVEGWNRGQGDEGGDRIERVLMPPMATGVGRVPKERWAAQLVMALKHFVDALEKPERWSRLTWYDLHDEVVEVEKTH